MSGYYDETSKIRYRALLLSFRINNTLELSNGRCACISCQKLFRSIEFLNMHFDNHHALELQELEQRSKLETTKQDLFIPKHKKLSFEHDSSYDVQKDVQDIESMSSLQRAERQTYIDLERSKDI